MFARAPVLVCIVNDALGGAKPRRLPQLRGDFLHIKMLSQLQQSS